MTKFSELGGKLDIAVSRAKEITGRVREVVDKAVDDPSGTASKVGQTLAGNVKKESYNLAIQVVAYAHNLSIDEVERRLKTAPKPQTRSQSGSTRRTTR